MPRYDAVIAGGGLSGLSLAAHLADAGWADRSVLVVDDPALPAARRWGFWSAGGSLLDAAASRTYRQVFVHAGGRGRTVGLGPYRYRTVHRADLAALVAARLRRCPGFELRRGTVQGLVGDEAGVRVLVDGRSVTARWAFDSVTPLGGPVDARLAFTGWEVSCRQPVFDPATPVLFDFRTPQAGGSRFVYVLPETPYRALVELTAFAGRRAVVPAPPERAAAVARYLADVVGAGAYEVLRTESAVLPLRVAPVPRGPERVVRIGAAAGLVKASTGFGCTRIQRDGAAIAASLAADGHPFGASVPPRRFRLLDAVLLDVLDRDPAQLERAFGRLFRRNRAERVLRFLDEDSRAPADLRLIASLPPLPYLRSLILSRHALD